MLKLRILIVTPAIVGINPGLTGGEMRFIELIRAWLGQGHEVHMFTSLGGKNLCESLGVKAHHYYIISDSPRETRWAFIARTLKILFTLPTELKKEHFDVIYSPSEQMYDVIPAWKIKKRLKDKTRWATVVHWLPPFPPWKRKSSSVINSTLFFISERIGVYLSKWKADVLLPVSSSTRKQLVEVFQDNKKFYAVDCGVHLNEIEKIVTPVSTKKYDAVFMKRLQAVKGIFDLIEIWEKVVQKKPDAKLAIIGSGIDGDRAREMVKQKSLENNIEFLGIIYDMKEKYTYIAESRLFVLPTYEENWAIVIGEAMAAGVPVLSYALSELVEVWQDQFIHVPVGDKDTFAQSILTLLNDENKQMSLSRSAKDFMKKYDWEIIAQRELEYVNKNVNGEI